ncbi:MAG: hypothetical protein RXR08_10370 [Sulfolobaceae archaeon]
MSSNIRFIDSNIFIYAILKPKRAINEKVTKMKEKPRKFYRGFIKEKKRSLLQYSEVANIIESMSNLTPSIGEILNNDNIIVKDLTSYPPARVPLIDSGLHLSFEGQSRGSETPSHLNS